MNGQDWSKLSPDELASFIEQDHLRVRQKLSQLGSLLSQPTEVGRLKAFSKFLPEFQASLEKHFASEEQLLLPYVRQMDAFLQGLGGKPEIRRSNLENPISLLESEHDTIESVMFRKIADIIGDLDLPTDASEAASAVCDGFRELKGILGKHIQIENTVLFPLAIELELSMLHKK